MAVPAGVDHAGPCIELSYVDEVHGRRRRPLRDCVTVRFEDVDPVRTFRWSRGERHFPGWYWRRRPGGTSALSRGWSGTDCCCWTSIRAWWGLARSPSGCTGMTANGNVGTPRTTSCAARTARRWSSIFVRRSDRAEGRRGVRGDASALRPGRVKVRAAGTPDAVVLANVRWLSRYRTFVVSAPPGGCPAPGSLRSPGTSDGGGRRRRGSAGDASGAVPPPAACSHSERRGIGFTPAVLPGP